MFTRLMLALLALTFTVAPASGQSTILGILEDVPGVYAGEPNFRGVRVVFQKNGIDWQAFPSTCPDQDCLRTLPAHYPQEVIWTIAFHGRNLGQITGRTPKEFTFYSHVGLQEIKGSGPVPTVGKRSAEYGGFADGMVYRPLVANSRPFFKDPESWEPSQLSAEFARLLRLEFRREYPKLCKTSKNDQTKLEPFLYRDDEVKIVKAYASKRGWALAQLHLGGAIDCGDLQAGSEIDDKWFTVDPQKSVRNLGDGMLLVDAGDYDNDGKSELVFTIDRYNRGGYELFYDDFKKHATFEFQYH
jgi:hypothetical protein